MNIKFLQNLKRTSNLLISPSYPWKELSSLQSSHIPSLLILGCNFPLSWLTTVLTTFLTDCSIHLFPDWLQYSPLSWLTTVLTSFLTDYSIHLFPDWLLQYSPLSWLATVLTTFLTDYNIHLFPDWLQYSPWGAVTGCPSMPAWTQPQKHPPQALPPPPCCWLELLPLV